ncbi:MAG: helix-turn-helix domain-containing protein [Holophaga sp.]|nr:helix-turn-helix domain-containing protein [Holophaga sp.]
MPELPPSLVGLDKALHEPARLSIVGCLWMLEEADFTFLAQQVGLTVGNLSFHLARLEDAGLVRIEKRFQGKVPRTTAALTSEGRSLFRTYRKSLLDFLAVLPDEP